MNELLKNIINLQEEIKGLKTTQATSCDSYMFYRYSIKVNDSVPSGKAFGERLYKLTFVPDGKNDDYIVNFYLCDRYPPKYLLRPYSSLTDKNVATFKIQSPAAVGHFEAYFTVYSTVSGRIEKDIIDELYS